jgi:hypothetical protein
LKTDGIAGLYRGFNISCVGIIVYRGLYFGMYDSIKPVMPQKFQDSFLASFLLGWAVTTGAGLGKFFCFYLFYFVLLLFVWVMLVSGQLTIFFIL